MTIKPVSDLRNHYPQIETAVMEEGPVFLTKNGSGAMVVMSMDDYSFLTSQTERKLEEADFLAARDSRRIAHADLFTAIDRALDA
ncbi:MAG: type II toxin-antitoxin system Phd/YefM family antitoxin [Coriobacteriales bacterium]|jgi:prevent-host-death family protein|nr:type II toxin-antitoxin system Phd/YefM family antitoxin [Coriobacteriales bacterium]